MEKLEFKLQEKDKIIHTYKQDSELKYIKLITKLEKNVLINKNKNKDLKQTINELKLIIQSTNDRNLNKNKTIKEDYEKKIYILNRDILLQNKEINDLHIQLDNEKSMYKQLHEISLKKI